MTSKLVPCRWLLAAVAMGVMLFSLRHPFPTVGIDGEGTEPGAGANRGGGAGGGRWISVQQLEKKLNPSRSHYFSCNHVHTSFSIFFYIRQVPPPLLIKMGGFRKRKQR